MKKYILFILLVTLISCNNKREVNTKVEVLNLNSKIGISDFDFKVNSISWSPINPKNPWKKTLPDFKGIPKNWQKVNVEEVVYDLYQFVYQHYYLGNFTKEEFLGYVSSWKIDTISVKYSKKPILCSFNIAIGVKNDSLVYKLDKNRNNDFSDDKLNFPMNLDMVNNSNLVSNVNPFKYEYINQGKINYKDIPIIIVKKENNMYYSIPQYFETSYNGNKLHVANGFRMVPFIDNTNLKYGDCQNRQIVLKDEFIQLENNIYKNLGANFRKMTLMLQKMPKDTVLYSTQVGYLAKTFSAKDVLSDSLIDLNNYRGKFVLINFWGSWCKGTCNTMHKINEAYKYFKGKDIEFISIAMDNKKAMKKFITENQLMWNHILSTRKNNIFELYGHIGTGSIYLLDKNGRIITNDIKPDHIISRIEKYVN